MVDHDKYYIIGVFAIVGVIIVNVNILKTIIRQPSQQMIHMEKGQYLVNDAHNDTPKDHFGNKLVSGDQVNIVVYITNQVIFT